MQAISIRVNNGWSLSSAKLSNFLQFLNNENIFFGERESLEWESFRIEMKSQKKRQQNKSFVILELKFGEKHKPKQ